MMLTKLKIYNLAYAELLRRQDVERQRPNTGIIKQRLMRRYIEEIEELHKLILIEEERFKGNVNAN